MKYKLHIPCASRPDLLAKAVDSLRLIGNMHIWWGAGEVPPEVYMIPGVDHHDPGVVSCVSLYNMCLHASRDDDVVFMAHNDIECHRDVAKRFYDSVYEIFERGEKWGAVFQHYDVLAAFNMKAIREVGPWDTMYFQYHADVDYYHALRKAGWKETYVGKPEEITHHGSSSVKSDPLFNFRTQFRSRSRFDLEYYNMKWGGYVGQERFSRPFESFDPVRDNYENRHKRRVSWRGPGTRA
jgi:hypothetical protein